MIRGRILAAEVWTSLIHRAERLGQAALQRIIRRPRGLSGDVLATLA